MNKKEPSTDNDSRRITRLRQYFPTILAVLVGIGLSLGLYFMVDDWERRNIRQEFDRAAESTFSSLIKATNNSLMIINSIRGLYDSSDLVSRAEFNRFVQNFEQTDIGINSLGWAPAVYSAYRLRHEELARADGLVGYSINEQSDNGRLTISPQRKLHFPILYREPLTNGGKSLGFDLASTPALLKLLTIAADTGETVTTDLKLPFPDDSSANTYLVFAPVYDKGKRPLSVDGRTVLLKGFILMSIDIGELVKKTFDRLQDDGLTIFLQDKLSKTPKTPIFPGHGDKKQPKDAKRLHRSAELKFADHKWIVTCATLPTFHDRFDRWEANFALTTGLILTFMLAVYMLMDLNRVKRIEALVAKRTSALNQATRKAKAATKAKSEFMTNMSHEIRTPLNAISGLTELSLSSQGLSATLKDYLKGIRKSSRLLLEIVDDILDFTKIESGKLTLSTSSFKLEELLTSISNAYAAKAAEKGLEFILDPVTDLPENVSGDVGRLKQILGNLVQNSIKFTEKGEVSLTISRDADVDQSAGHFALLFEIRDTGIGIAPERVETIFNSFTQEDTSFTRRFSGTGLGLSICKNLVQMMGGDIKVKSSPGQGSTFYFTLAMKETTAPEEKTVSKTILSEKKILIVDQNISTAKATSQLMQSFGMTSETASSGSEALALLAGIKGKGEFDIILADWTMASMSGIELFQRIKSEGWTSKQPKLVLAIPPGVDAKKIREQVAMPDIVLNKPLYQSELGELLAELLTLPSDSPLSPKGKPEAEQEKSRLTDLRGATVLLVEDIELNQHIATQILNNVGLQVVIANNGQECIDLLEKETHFQAIFMDIQMPVMDGLEATKRLRADPRFKNIPIIAMTAHALNGDREKGLQAGMNDYLTKPIDQKALKKAIVRWINPDLNTFSPAPEDIQAVKPETSYDFSPLSGIDIKSGLDRLGGNQTLFRDLLLKFKNKHALAGTDVKNLLENDAREAAGRIIHTLKGISGNISAKRLYQAAINLEKEIKDDSTTTFRELPKFEKALNDLVHSIETFESRTRQLVQDSTIISQPLNKSKAIPLLIELKHLLETNDYQAVNKIVEVRKATSASVPAIILDNLDEQIGNFDFPTALTTLDAMAKSLDIVIEE